MKSINMRELQQKLRETLVTAQDEHVVVTRHGEPIAIVVGIKGYDWEDVFWATNPAFWKMVQRRRGESTIPIAEVRRQLQGEHQPQQ